MSKLERRRDSDGKVRFSFRYIDVDGTRKRHTPDVETEHEALRIMAEVKARVARGIVGVPDVKSAERQQSTITLSEVLARWVKDGGAVAHYKCPSVYRLKIRSNVKALIATLGDVPLLSIRRADLSRAIGEWQGKGLKQPTYNSRISALSCLWKWAQDAGLLPEVALSPCRKMAKPVNYHVVDYYSADEIARMLQETESDRALHTMIAVALYTGMRKGELYGLRWRDINLHNHTIRIERSYRLLPKSGKARTVPLHPDLIPILKAWQPKCPHTEESLVLPYVSPSGIVRMGRSCDDRDPEFKALLRKAGCHVPGRFWHALRHTFASHYVMSGGSLTALQQHLGHYSITQTMTYAHLAPDFARADMQRLSFKPQPAQLIPFPTRRRTA